MTQAPDPSWERRHPSDREFWSFDFCAADAGLGGFVGLTLHSPPRPVAWYWAALVGTGRPYLLVRDLEIEVPRRPDSFDIRAEGLWADVNCETPFDHWSLGLEAFGVAMDDPDEALGDERGDRIGLGLDLEWEAVAEIAGGEGDYAQPCNVHGEILVGVGSAVETIAFEGHGWRRHTWGAPAPCLPPPGDRPAGQAGGAGPGDRPAGDRLWGRLDDGTPYMSPAGAGRPDSGRHQLVDHGAVNPASAAEADVSHRQAAATCDVSHRQAAATCDVSHRQAAATGDVSHRQAAATADVSHRQAAATAAEADPASATESEPARHVLFRAPIRLGAGQWLERSLCRFTMPHSGTSTSTGIGWHEQVKPVP